MDITTILERGVSEVIDAANLRRRLEAGTPLRIKLGVDPTSPHLHLGRMVPLLKLRDFQQAGHTIVLIVGNATGVIGDTSDKDSERPMLTHEAVAANMAAYAAQAGKILDMDRVEVVYNADWLDALGFREIGELADAFSVHEFTQRENIRKRLDAGKRVSLREVLYPLMQGYDSVHLRTDVEVGGTDQRFNMLAGRTLQERAGIPAQDVVMTGLIPGTDGRKMSSSWGNTINLTDDPRTMFGKLMSVPDEVIVPYLTHATRLPMADVTAMETGMRDGTLNPRDAKLALAHEVVRMLVDTTAADAERDYFVTTFSQRQAPTDAPAARTTAGEPLIDLMVREGLAASKGDARRKIAQGGVALGEVRVTDPATTIAADADGVLLRVGKKDFRILTCSAKKG